VIQYLENYQINKQKWDACVAKSFNGIIYAYSWYLGIVSPDWKGLVEDDYISVMPLCSRKKIGISYLFQPFFTQQHGVFSTARLTEDKTNEFLSSIPTIFKLIEINLNTFNKTSDTSFTIEKKSNIELDLIESYENIAKNYSQNHQRNIKKARQNGLVISYQVNIQDVISVFKDNRGKNLETFKKKDYETLTKLIEHCTNCGIGHTVGVFNSDKTLCAGAFFIESNNKVIFIFSSTNKEAKEKSAMFLLLDSFIKENSQKNITLDFEGSNDENLARFYKGFGSKECVYLQLRRNRLPFLINWLKK